MVVFVGVPGPVLTSCRLKHRRQSRIRGMAMERRRQKRRLSTRDSSSKTWSNTEEASSLCLSGNRFEVTDPKSQRSCFLHNLQPAPSQKKQSRRTKGQQTDSGKKDDEATVRERRYRKPFEANRGHGNQGTDVCPRITLSRNYTVAPAG